jgi:glycosyltransferase involved in cell wall biosynthesis
VTPPRVLHVVEAIESGVARYVSDVVHHVDAEHHVVAPQQRVGGFTDVAALDEMRSTGAEVHFITMRRSPVDPRNALAVTRIRRLIRRIRPDIVHGHASIGGVAARLAATGTGAARVYTPNGLIPSRSVFAIERALGHVTDRFVAVSESEADVVVARRLVPAERVAVIPNGIDLEYGVAATIDLRAELGVGPESPLVGAIGRLARQKAPEVFIRACAQVGRTRPDARFVLIGDGPLAGLVADEIAASGLGERFLHLRGLLRAASVIGQLDVFVQPSRYEGGPYAPLEAMRAGTPVVLTDVVGSRDTVEDGQSGLLVPADDPTALAGAVMRLLQDQELRHRIGAAGRARCLARFGVQEMAERLSAAYFEVMKGQSRVRRRERGL